MDQETRQVRQKNPRQNANILSVITFFYNNILFKSGWKKDIEDKDVYEVLPKFSSRKLGDKLEDQWQRNTKKGKKFSLFCLLISCFGKTYLFWGLVQFIVRTALIYYQPRALSKLVAYFQDDQTSVTTKELYQLAGIVIGLNLFSTFYNHNYQQAVAEVGIRVRTSVASLIYRKALKLGPSALSEITTGKIVTLITRDIFSFEAALIFANDMWIAVTQITFVSYLIYRRIGWSVLSGIGFYLLIIPIQLWIGKGTSFRRIQAAKRTDERLQFTTEALSAIKIIKMYNWETFFADKLNILRTTEMNRIALVFYLKCIVIIIAGLASHISFFLLIMTYIWNGHYADAEIIVFVQSSFSSLRSYITASIPMGIVQCADVHAALKRLKHFLEIEEVSTKTETNIIRKPRIYMNKVSVEIKDVEVLKSVSLSVEKGLFLVSGSVGSGKSSILKTLLGDYPVTSGKMIVEGSISYASQEPWLFPSTIKQNILFGQPYDAKRYQEVLNACALTVDFNEFDQGDQTIVGDRGINLSKGQQARINLARAVYKDSDIYLLDDCLSSLDTHVNMYVFTKCIMEFLKDKIVILVTHNINHIKHVYGHNTIFVSDGATLSLDKQKDRIDKRITYYIDDVNFDHFEEEDKVELDDLIDADENTKLLTSGTRPTDLYHEEKKIGKVNWRVYARYFKYAGGVPVFILVVVVFSISQLMWSFSEKLVSKWINVEPRIAKLVETNLTNATNLEKFEEALHQRNSILNMYCMMIGIGTVLLIIRVYFNFFFAVKASRNLHNSMALSVFHSIMSFFDSHFVGNIINRFSKDLNYIDEYMPLTLYEVFRCTYSFISIVILIASVNWTFLIPAAFLMVKLYMLRRYYLPTGRSLKRLEAATRSPMIGYLNSSLEGLSTVRAAENQALLREEFDRHQDLFTSASYMGVCTTRAFALWLDLISSIFFATVVLKCVFFNADEKAGDVALVITQASMLSGFLQYTIRQYSEIENGMTSVERVIEYTDIRTENTKAGLVKADWPSKGKIEYVNVCLTYETTKQQVLKNVNFAIEARQKVGIVGRTGAGKSSIISTLFRLYDIDGKILIDGADTKMLALEFLRSQIAIIPQDPVLFTGTIRSNIDPSGKHSDETIWSAIEHVNLKHLFSTLNEPITENGSNFSAGQKQLICLSRALISKNKIIVLDEATASMDPETCRLLQMTIRKNFYECTVITIAHRLNTVMDSDKVMVVDGGRIMEYDAPDVLLNNTNGVFYRMVKQSGLLESDRKKID